MEVLFSISFVYLAVSIGLAFPVLALGAERAKWKWWELVGVILPLGGWFLAFTHQDMHQVKSIGNLIEPFFLVPCFALAAIIRAWCGTRAYPWLTLCLFILLILAGLGVAAFTPTLAEAPPSNL